MNACIHSLIAKDLGYKISKTLLVIFISKKKRLDANNPLLPDWTYRKAKRKIEVRKAQYGKETKRIEGKKIICL